MDHTYETVVIGGGQSGLAAGHHLGRRGVDFLLLEAEDRIGDVWRARWDSLRLYSPAKYDALPGKRFDGPGHRFPSAREMGDYLEAYADRERLSIRTGVRATRIRATGDGYAVETSDGTLAARQVIVATGPFQHPFVPAVARELDPGIRQIHSADYRRPDQLADGPVLVVGLGHSGADIAHEAAIAGHRTVVAGMSHGQLPFSVDSRRARVAWPILRFVAMNLLTLRTPIGRKMAPRVRLGGGPLLRYRRQELLEAGVEMREARVVGARDGRPLLADDSVHEVATVVWCTGFRPDFRWVEPATLDELGWPLQERGLAVDAPGLYFLGMPFLFGFTSMLVLGADRDAAYVADAVVRRAATDRRSHAEMPQEAA
ncbi:MAG TPA: NAD(P)-binding domain-containing protein [Candidatus Limnocylindria bacterium]